MVTLPPSSGFVFVSDGDVLPVVEVPQPASNIVSALINATAARPSSYVRVTFFSPLSPFRSALVSYTDWRGMGLLATSMPCFDFSAHHYSTHKFEQAQHTHELVEDPFITLNLDYVQNGLGTASCGPGVLPQYELTTRPFSFTITLKPYSKDKFSPTSLGKRLMALAEGGVVQRPESSHENQHSLSEA
jgi:hypothetical protein